MSSFLGGTRSGKAARSKSIQQKKKKKTKEKVERKKEEVRSSGAYTKNKKDLIYLYSKIERMS
jgi:hypothetical protein